MSRLLVTLAATGALLLPAQATAQSGPVLVIGDSLEVGTGPPLRRALKPVPVTVDARTGRPSAEGVRALRERLRPSHKVVVFDLGTNDDPSQTAPFGRNLAAARDLVGDRCLVVSTLARPPVNGVSVDGMNRTVRDFVDSSPDARLVDWEAAVESEPSLLASDEVHATPAGYVSRSRLVAAAIDECFGAGDAPARTRRAAPESDPRPQPRPRSGTPRRNLPELLALMPVASVVDWAEGVAASVILAGQNVGGALGPQPPEIELGAPKPER